MRNNPIQAQDASARPTLDPSGPFHHDGQGLKGDYLHLVANEIFNAQEEERLRVSRDLHDNIGQLLALMNFRVGVCFDLASDENERLREELGQLQDETRITMKALCACIEDLRPPVLAEYGLAACIEHHVSRLQRRNPSSTRIELRISPDIPEIEESSALTIFRVLQEATSNALRHSQANTIRIEVERLGGDLRIIVKDDGIGFATNESDGAHIEQNIGIKGMRERASFLDGSLRIESQLGQGTIVCAIFPIGTRAS